MRKTKADITEENTELKLEILKAHEAITELRAYLQSPKFHQDPTVQTADVLRRLEEVRLNPDEATAKWSAKYEQWENKELFLRNHPSPESFTLNH